MAESSGAKAPKVSDSTKPAKPISDVAHADEIAPETSSKPILVTNRPIMKDPMMAPANEPASELAEAIPVKVRAKSELQLAADQAEFKPDEKEEKPAENKPPVEPQPAEPEEKPAEEKPTESERPRSGEDAPNAAAIDDAEAARQAEHDAAIDKLIESKKYYLPVNSVEKRKSQRFVLLGVLLSMVLALAWADVALDAGLIQIGNVKPVTHFFSN